MNENLRQEAQRALNCLALEVPVRVYNDFRSKITAYTESLEAEIDALKRERDLAIAHDRQPYPTAEAYEKVCKVLNAAKRREAAMREANKRLCEIAVEFIGPDEGGTSECTCCGMQLTSYHGGHRQDCLANAILEDTTQRAFKADAGRDLFTREQLLPLVDFLHWMETTDAAHSSAARHDCKLCKALEHARTISVLPNEVEP